MNLGFRARLETLNAVEAYLGSLPGHHYPNIRRPLLHTLNLADLLPTTAIWAGLEHNPNPLYPEKSPPWCFAATTGATPFRINLHVDDLGHTLLLGKSGAGKSTALALCF
jgi:type IV secretion system protein VirB4